MVENFHMRMASTEDLIDEVQRRGMTIVPGGGELARGEFVVRTDEKSAQIGNTISRWQTIVGVWAMSKGWSDPKPPIPEQIALMHSELSEALEDHRNGWSPTEIRFDGDERKPCGIPTEMADTVIRILHFCALNVIDLEAAMSIKHAFNVTREHKHGGKRC